MYGMKTLFALLASLIPNDMRMPTLAGNKTGNAKRRPTGAALRNPADPFQAARIQAAADKRDRKGAKRERFAMSSSYNNPCLNGRISNLNPFYVAK